MMTTRYTELQQLRRRMWNSRGNRPAEDGIFITWQTRYRSTGTEVREDLLRLGALCYTDQKSGKGSKGTQRNCRLEFTVDTGADAYLMKRINMRELKAWDADKAVLHADSTEDLWRLDNYLHDPGAKEQLDDCTIEALNGLTQQGLAETRDGRRYRITGVGRAVLAQLG